MNEKGKELQLCIVDIQAKGNRLLNKKNIKGYTYYVELGHSVDTEENYLSRKEKGLQVAC